MRVFLFFRFLFPLPLSGEFGGLKKLESLSDVPRAYAGLPFSSRFLFPLPLSGEFGGLKWARTTDLALIRRAL